MSRKTRRKKKQAMIKNHKQKKTPREKSRKEVITWEVIGIALFVLSWVCIILPAVLSDSEGHLSYGWVFLVLFFYLKYQQRRGTDPYLSGCGSTGYGEGRE